MMHTRKEIKSYIDSQAFILCAQGIIDIKNHKVEGLEILTRIEKEDGSFIYPDEFLPIIKENHGEFDFDMWVIKETFKKIKNHQASFEHMLVHINVDTVTLSDYRLYEWLLSVESPINRNQIIFEILENSGSLQMIEVVKKISRLGYIFAIDDFGTGYSSFERIKDIGVTYIKIDKVFMDHMTERIEDLLILKHMIEMAQNLNLKVVAEGIESLEQLEFLYSRNCFLIQGFLFSKPIPVTLFINQLSEMATNIIKILKPLNSLNIQKRQFYHQGQVFVQDINKNQDIRVANLRLCHYLSYPLKIYEKMNFSEFIPETYKELWHEFIKEVLESGEEKALMFPLVDYNQKIHHVLSVVQSKDLFKSVRIYLEFLEVLEEGTLSLMGLSKSYTQAFAYAPIGIMILSDNFHIEKCNQAAKDIFGYGPLELLGQSVMNPLMLKEQRMTFQKLLMNSHKQTVASQVIESKRTDGKLIKGKWQISMIGQASDPKVKYVCMVEDVTAAIKQEQTIKRAYHALDNSLSMIVMIDDGGDVTYINPQYTKLTGYKTKDFLENTYWDYIDVFKEEVISSIGALGVFEKEAMLVKKDRTYYKAHISIHLIKKNEMGGGFLVVQRDLSQEQALQAENMEIKNAMIGQSHKNSFFDLSAGVLNEINNPLSALKTDALYLKEKWDDLKEDEIKEVLEDVNHSIKLLTRFFKGLEPLNQRVPLDVHVIIDLKELIEEVLEITKSIYYYDVSLSFIYDETICYLVKGNPSELKQSIGHLIANGVSAIKKNKNTPGKLIIELLNLKDQVHLKITDNGIGMRDEIIEKIYDPLFTTDKEKSGIGLSVVKKSIVENHMGEITCESKESKGTVFKITLPKIFI